MIGTPIAFGLTMIVCFTLFYYYWRIRQLRARLLSVQAAPVLEDIPVEFGIGKNVVETFPTIKACELKCTATEDLQCPICLVEYEEWEVLRQLPFCGHIFHTLCVGAWFEKQTTCPVCRMSMSEITEPFDGSLSAADNRCSEVNMVNRHLPLIPSPPAPASTITTERILLADVISPPASLNNNSIVTHAVDMMKPTHDSNGCVQPESHEDVTLNAADVNFHVVNILPEEWGPTTTCHKCRQPTRSPKIFASEDSVAARSSLAEQQQQQSEPNNVSHVTDGKGVTILISQSVVQSNTVELNVYTNSGEREDSSPESLNPKNSAGTNELAAIEEADFAMVNVTTSEATNVIPGDSKAMSDSPPGSFQFQPGIVVNEEVKSTTESSAGASPPL